MAMMLPGHLVEALNMCGFDWPSSNEDVLNQWADELAGMAAGVANHTGALDTAYRAVVAANDGTAVDRFEAYVFGTDAAKAVMNDFSSLCNALSGGARTAAGIIVILKGAVIAQLVILAGAILAAIASGGLLAGAAAVAREGCKRLIEAALNIAVERLLAGE